MSFRTPREPALVKCPARKLGNWGGRDPCDSHFSAGLMAPRRFQRLRAASEVNVPGRIFYGGPSVGEQRPTPSEFTQEKMLRETWGKDGGKCSKEQKVRPDGEKWPGLTTNKYGTKKPANLGCFFRKKKKKQPADSTFVFKLKKKRRQVKQD